MQFLTVKALITTGPFGFPIRGSISSMVPTVKSPVAFALLTRKWPVLGLKAEPPIPAGEMAPPNPAIMGPRWQGTSTPRPRALWPLTPDGAGNADGSGHGMPAFGPLSSTFTLMLLAGELS